MSSTDSLSLVFFHDVPEDLVQELQRDSPAVSIQVCTSRQDVYAALPQAEVLVSFKCTRDMLDRSPELKWVQALSTGVDTLPLSRLEERNILVTSTRGIHAGHMSELAIMAMIMLARNMHHLFWNQTLKVWDRKIAQDEIAGKTLGILGLGSIGREVAAKASALGMQVIGVKNRPEPVESVHRIYALEDMQEVFAQSDYVLNLLPLTQATRECIGSRHFGRMAPNACFINLGRGGSVNEQALIDALRTGSMRALFSDVFAQEPLSADSPFWEMDNVIIMPHMGGESMLYMHKAMPIIRHNLQAYVQGRVEDMRNLYQPERGY